ncbi:Transglutaminase-like enzyme, putative cysteine protease [Desulfatibacillum alkenivorans DSM 16219]|jgi:transglutaminase-like putative cysteine protease|uniref:Transglutaminase-like enzyme, putative cysteine protease n=1 Tax=Desulfatibacillum alkenivorans DSM 16219 TaxID=1121393 RepID=A0A1M6I9F7_9BACT|nr:transglutaminase family protein [Desulfatibacillum alkenivorans]SHJ31114.1 Transglutaminase-like enzyme, putative cysteine protease [Desulfatibacillum alkenivorans DSM 16219]
MKYKVIHKTSYEYSEPAALSQNELCLFPRDAQRQVCESKRLTIRPKPTVLESRLDFFGNHVHNFMVQQPHQTLAVITESVIQTADWEGPDPASTAPWESIRERLASHENPEDLAACQFVYPSDFVSPSKALAAYAKESFTPGRPALEAALDLTARIFTEFKYDKDATNIGTPLQEVLKIKKGVCQDFAHLQIGCLRSLGLAARYVSGYLETIPPPGKQKLTGADASHAWLAVHIPELGWVDLDPTNNMIPGRRHITVAWGRDYGDVTPAKGVVWGGGAHNLIVGVDVIPLENENPG